MACIHPEQLWQALPIAGAGLLGTVTVMALIALGVALLNKWGGGE